MVPTERHRIRVLPTRLEYRTLKRIDLTLCNFNKRPFWWSIDEKMCALTNIFLAQNEVSTWLTWVHEVDELQFIHSYMIYHWFSSCWMSNHGIDMCNMYKFTIPLTCELMERSMSNVTMSRWFFNCGGIYKLRLRTDVTSGCIKIVIFIFKIKKSDFFDLNPIFLI